MRAIRRKGFWHFPQTTSIPKTLRKSSDHRIYLDRFLGLSCSAGGGAAGAGTTWLREPACEESTPKCRAVSIVIQADQLGIGEKRVGHADPTDAGVVHLGRAG
jgi:hypothetical protein